MSDIVSKFVEKVKASYTPSGAYIYLGAGMLEGQTYAEAEVNLPLKMMNRHGLIAGATGTGKTRTLQVLAEQLSQAEVPVFMLDVKGDLSGLFQEGQTNPKLEERAVLLQKPFTPVSYPIEQYSLSGKLGAQMRATVTEFGPVLLAKILDLNDTQTGVLSVLFKYADDHKMPIVDLADLKKVLAYLSEGEGAAEIKADYGSISSTTASTILRKIVAIEQQGLGNIFGETSFDISDLFQKVDGKGLISLLNISDVQNQPVLYSTFLLSLLAEIFNSMPEVGDLEKPKLVFFFDEAHLLFNDAPKAFLEQINTIIRLIRSKGIGIFFCTQSPMDVPESVLAQLGNRVQHALRAFTPNDVDALKKTVNTYPKSDFYTIDRVLTSLGTGQALITVLNEKGIPTEVVATMLASPKSVMGPLAAIEAERLMQSSVYFKKYQAEIDPVSAYELLTQKINDSHAALAQAEQAKAIADQAKAEALAAEKEAARNQKYNSSTSSRKTDKSVVEQVMGATITRQIGREIVRGLFGMLMGKKSRSR